MIISGGVNFSGGIIMTSLSAPGPVVITSATMTTLNTATILFTGPTNRGSFTVTSVTAVSYPGLITGSLNTSGTGTITVSGLSSGTFYRFSVYANSEVGPGTETLTPIVLPYTYGSQAYTVPGTYSWINANPNVTSVSVVAIGAGGSGKSSAGTVVDNSFGGTSTFVSGSVASALGGRSGYSAGTVNFPGYSQGGTGQANSVVVYGGNAGGVAANCASSAGGGGGGAGGYVGNSLYYASLSGSQALQATLPSALGTADFTVEWWVNPGSFTTNSFPGMFDIRTTGSDTAGFGVYFNAGTFIVRIGSVSSTISSNASMVIGVWHHVAVVRTAGNLNIYINGINRLQFADATNFTRTLMNIGQTFDPYKLVGSMSNLRVVRQAVYTGNFVPPVLPLATTQSSSTNISAIASSATTAFLTLQNATIVDNGGSLAITNVGSVTTTLGTYPGSGIGGRCSSGTNGFGGGGGGGGYTGSLGAGGGGTGIFGLGASGAGGTTSGSSGIGGGSGSCGSAGTSTVSAGTYGGGGVYGGGGGGSAGGGGAGGSLVYANTVTVVYNLSYTVIVGAAPTPSGSANSIGGGGAVRIVWPASDRQFPSTLVAACSALTTTTAYTNFPYPVVTSSTAYFSNNTWTGIAYVQDAFTQTGIKSYLFTGQAGGISASAYTTLGSAILTFPGISVPSTATIYSTSILGDSVGSTSTIFNTMPPIEILLVGGGGGGGGGTSTHGRGGGGGAGGLVYVSSQTISSGVLYSVIIGAGAAASASTIAGNAGSTSSFIGGAVTRAAVGGGGGGGWSPSFNGLPGGSGGGGASNNTVGGTSTQFATYGYGVGFAGGAGSSYTNNTSSSGGGGGGAGGVGANHNSGVPGNGGTGTFTTIISTTLALTLGVGQYITATNAVYFAGGGAGGGGTATGIGGFGGGGNGAFTTDLGTAAKQYSGGGGGGGGGSAGGSSVGTAGGSGIAILRYPTSFNPAVVNTATYVVEGGYRNYIFTASGTILFN